jgi:tetratricopeptide (TPR) repeat protein
LIVETSLNYLRRLAADAGQDPALALDLGTAYMRVGRVQGVPISPNLGQMDNAEQNLRVAEDLIHSVLKTQPGNRTAALRAAQIAHDRMVLAESRRPDSEALPLAYESEKWLNKYLTNGHVDEDEKDQVVIVGMNVANWYARKELPDAALRLLRRTIDIARATGQQRQAGAAQIVVARTLRSIGDLDGALAAIREGVNLLEPQPGQTSTGALITFGLALATEGEVLGEDDSISLNRPQEAIEYLERGFRMAVDMAQQDPNDSRSRLAVGNRGVKLAGILRHSDPAQALVIYDQVLQHLAEVKNNSGARLNEITALAGSTYALRQIGRSDDARHRLDAAFSRLRELKLYPAEQIEPDSESADAGRALAEFEAGTGNFHRGAEIYEELVSKIMASKPNLDTNLEAATKLSNIYQAMADLYRRAKQPDAASRLYTRRFELWHSWQVKLPHNEFLLRQTGEK